MIDSRTKVVLRKGPRFGVALLHLTKRSPAIESSRSRVWSPTPGFRRGCSIILRAGRGGRFGIAQERRFPRRKGLSTGPSRSPYREAWHSTEWDGEPLDRGNLRLRGMDLAFEPRLTFSEDGRELQIAERISGPKGQTRGDFEIPLGEKGTTELE